MPLLIPVARRKPTPKLPASDFVWVGLEDEKGLLEVVVTLPALRGSQLNRYLKRYQLNPFDPERGREVAPYIGTEFGCFVLIHVDEIYKAYYSSPKRFCINLKGLPKWFRRGTKMMLRIKPGLCTNY